LVVLTTSQQGFYRENPEFECDVVRLEPACVPFFKLETILNCREVWSLSREQTKVKFVTGQIVYIGDMPEEVMVRATKTLRESRQIAKKMKKQICPQ
jgi:hypothetical protein